MKQYRELFSEAGFTVRHTKTSIGAAVGTGFHAAAADILTNGVHPGTLDVGMEAAQKQIDEYNGVETDDTTPSLHIARLQLERMLKAWMPLSLTYQAVFTERKLECDAGDGFTYTGHPDIFTLDGRCIDNKTGVRIPSPQLQLGLYGVLLKANGYDVKYRDDREVLEMHYLKRVGVNKPQPAPIVEVYNLVECVKAAMHTGEVIKESVLEFSKTGDPVVFLANPRSMLCTETYCPAHGTDACSMWRA